jgi:SAM-dependent methyltransferase
MPMQAIKPRFPWLAYNEPEQHLDDVASRLYKLPGIGTSSRMLGVTYKDQSTLDRLAKLGLPSSSCISKEDFSIFNTPKFAKDVKAKLKPVDLLIARHVIEHAEDALEFINDLKEIIAPGGYLVFELPECEKVFQAGNHAFIWEEHISYFVEHSLPILAEKVGAKLVWAARYPYNYEDSLVAVFQFTSYRSLDAESERVSIFNVNELLEQFKQEFAKTKADWRDLLQNYRSQGHKIAVFGAGHLAVKWINFLCLSDLLDCVIDDNSNKAGMFMPGSKLPILPSSVLQDRNIKVCISTLSPESEHKVRLKLSRYFDEGGIFIPAFKIMRNEDESSPSESK